MSRTVPIQLLRLLALAIALLLAWTPRAARADDFLKSSPGELAMSHAALDNQSSCNSCHERRQVDRPRPSASAVTTTRT